MTSRRFAACVVLLFVTSACGGGGGGGVEAAGGAAGSALVSEGADRIVAGGGTLPAPSVSIGYRDADAFDLELYSSLRQLDDVRVNFPNPERDLPTRTALWTSRIQRSGGQIATCDIGTSSGLGAGALIALGKLVATWMFGRLQASLLYAPASSTSAIIEVDGRDKLARSVRFVDRANFATARGENRYSSCVNG